MDNLEQRITRLEEFGSPGAAGEQGEKGDPGEKGDHGEKGEPGSVNCYTRAEADERFALASDGWAYAFTIPVEAWTQSVQIDYPLEADVPASGIGAADLVRADFDASSLMLAAEAQICSAVDTSGGKMTFYAKAVPGGVVGGLYTIHKARG